MRPFNLSEWLENPSLLIVTRDGRPARILDYNLKGYKRICIAIDDKIQESIITVDENGHSLRDEYRWHESKFDLFFADEEDQSQSIEIPFGAKDSEFIRDEYCIPEGCEARIEGNKVIIEKVQKEEELTEFEKELEMMMVSFSNGNLGSDVIKEMPKQKLHDCAYRLLDLARKELEKNIEDDAIEFAKSYMEDANPSFEKVQESEELWKWKMSCLRGINKAYKQGKQDALKGSLKWKRAAKHKEFEVHVCVMDEDMYPYLDTEVNEGEHYIELSDLKTLPKEETDE